MPVYTRVRSLEPLLNQQLQALQNALKNGLPGLAGVLLIGSCSRGTATYRSDIDLLVILESGPLNYSRVQEIRDELERQVEQGAPGALHRPLEVQFTVVLKTVFETREPAMREALRQAIVISDPSGTVASRLRELQAGAA